eukprot:NODE_7123_length_1606_cov_8.597025.p1 GENE.NODE_7123_length_1606_cov_8.597025~~NODE_7123_length_1606_cov_8.597025.p1  ORF type:complete len:421 (-),score=92.33 NODE_7123_length_1606_cov_8.597025:344-1606(-)
MQAYGPVAVKFAQWASTRPDILPAKICANFSVLQTSGRPHSAESTAKCLEEAFGPDWFATLQLDPEPVGCGCIAQVYHGRLLPEPGAPEKEVAVKVRHPGAQEKLDLDLAIMWKVVNLLEGVFPHLRLLCLHEAVACFEAFVRPQTDLTVEAENLDAFAAHFEYGRTGRGLRVRFPQVVRPYVAESVLVESYEHGAPLQVILGQPDAEQDLPCCDPEARAPRGVSVRELRNRLGHLCIDLFLQMLFADNFVHGDLHPGNILFRFAGESEHASDDAEPEVVILDAGLAVEMAPHDRKNFVSVFHAVATRQWDNAGRMMVEQTPGDRNQIVDEAAFISQVAEAARSFCGQGLHLGSTISFGALFGRILSLAFSHHVKLEPKFVTVMTSLIVLDGVGRQLNPVADILLAARPLLIEAVKQRFQ